MGVRNPSQDAKEKAREAEQEAKRIERVMYGYVLGLVARSLTDTEFDQDEWESLYSDYVIFDSYSFYPTNDPTTRKIDYYQVTDWDHEKEQNYLRQEKDLPADRDGMLIFEKGTTALTFGGERYLVDLRDNEFQFLRSLSEARMDTIREGYGRA